MTGHGGRFGSNPGSLAGTVPPVTALPFGFGWIDCNSRGLRFDWDGWIPCTPGFGSTNGFGWNGWLTSTRLPHRFGSNPAIPVVVGVATGTYLFSRPGFDPRS